MNTGPSTVHCSQCGREASAIFRCPERRHGGCPFVKRWTGRPSPGFLAALAILGFVATALMQVWWPLLTGIIAALLWWLIFVRVQFYNAAAGTAVESTAFGGVETKCSVMVKGQVLPIAMEPLQPIEYPLSILTLAGPSREIQGEEDLAVWVLRAALVDLLTMGLVEVHPLRVSERLVLRAAPSYSTDFYFTVRDRDWIDEFELGSTEEQLLTSVADWRFMEVQLEKWREGPRIHELIRAFFVEDRAHPSRWVLENVEKNALAYRLCKALSSGHWRGRRKWTISGGPDTAEELEASCQAFQELSDRFAGTYPELWNVMHSGILSGIRSRVLDMNVYWP